jgi:hypothetical protein
MIVQTFLALDARYRRSLGDDLKEEAT